MNGLGTLFAGVYGASLLVLAPLVAHRSYRWNRRRGRLPVTATAIATLAALIWPVTLAFWEADWLVTGRRTWRGDR